MIEMLIVLALIALMTGLSYPSLSAGLTTLRMRSASNSIATFLTVAVDRAERSQQAVELVVSMADNTLTAVSADATFRQRIEISDGIRIVNVLPATLNSTVVAPTRSFVLYPGAPVPRIGIEIAGPTGPHRIVAVDPLTGFSRVEAVTP